jgi:predicted ATPase
MGGAATGRRGQDDRHVVGRERELTVLEAAFADSVAGRGRLFLLTGEPGIGKTRLAREIAERAGARGALACWGRCWEAGGAPEYWPWVQILRSLVAKLEPDFLASEPPERIERLGRVLPELSSKVSAGAEPPTDSLEGELGRFRLFEAAGALLARLSAGRPLVLVVDDLHAADPSSILLLRFVAGELRDARALLIGTYREAEARQDPVRARLLADLQRDANVLAVEPLGEREVAQLVQQEVGELPPDALVRDVYRLSEGNPLLAGEALRLLLVRRDGERAGDSRDLGVPDRLHDLVRGRLDSLSGDCADLLTVAAVIGREFDVADLRQATAQPPEQVLDLLGEAQAGGMIRPVLRDGSLYGFSHGLLREAAS